MHGASFAVRGGQWLYVALKAAKPSPHDRACFVTWSGFQPRLVPSLVDDTDDVVPQVLELPAGAVPALDAEWTKTLAIPSKPGRSDEEDPADFPGAGHAVRTRDPELGKLVLYQLS